MLSQATQTGLDSSETILLKNPLKVGEWQGYLDHIRDFEKSIYDKFLQNFSKKCRKEALEKFDHNLSGLIIYLESTIKEFIDSDTGDIESTYESDEEIVDPIELNKRRIRNSYLNKAKPDCIDKEEKAKASAASRKFLSTWDHKYNQFTLKDLAKVERKNRIQNEKKVLKIAKDLPAPTARCPEAEKALQMLTYRGPIYKCSQCSRFFKTTRRVELHKESCGKTRYICDFCPSKFRSTEELARHVKQHEGKQTMSPEKLLKEAHQKSLLPCIHCKNRLWIETKHNMVQGSEAKVFQCDICDIWYTRRELYTHCSECHHIKKPYECEKCPATFKKVHTLREHKLKQHMRELKNIIFCTICHETFPSKALYERHRTTAHTSDLPYKCEVCSEYFKHPYLLQNHQAVHTGKKRYQCDFCEEGFRMYQPLKAHRYKHLDIWPFKCDVCLDPFHHRSNYMRHLKVHESGLDVKWHYCPQCNVHFRSSNAVQMHRMKNKLLKRKCGEDLQCDDPAGELAKPRKKAKKVEVVPSEVQTAIEVISSDLNTINYNPTNHNIANSNNFNQFNSGLIVSNSTSNFGNHYILDSSISSQPFYYCASTSSDPTSVSNSWTTYNNITHLPSSFVISNNFTTNNSSHTHLNYHNNNI